MEVKGGVGLPRGLSGKESACNAGDTGGVGSIPALGRSPREENDNPLQYSCLGIPRTKQPGGLQYVGCKELDTI